ncbi:MAG: hypothetical protein H6681_05100 [Desulfobacteraceae bacterium]|nr:hypothetical protein [Desulfobacteraceae bacterium]
MGNLLSARRPYLLFNVLNFFWIITVMAFLFNSCGGSSGDGGDKEPASPYGSSITLSGNFTWDPSAGLKTAQAAISDPVDIITDQTEGFTLEITDISVVDGIARVKTRIKNLSDPDDIMIDLTAQTTQIEGQNGITDDGPWIYGDLDNNSTSDIVEWKFFNVDTLNPLTVYVSVTWTKEQNTNTYEELIATSDYGGQYYLINPETGEEVYCVSPQTAEALSVKGITMGYLGQRAYFLSKPASSSGNELFACDTLTGENLIQLTHFDRTGMNNPDACPVNNNVAFEGAREGGITNIYVISKEGEEPVQITGDELIEVPGADDPTENWGSKSPAWSPDGCHIAYSRYSKDTLGPNIPELNAVIVASPGGQDKIAVYASQSKIENICWTYDNEFLIFTEGQTNDQGKKITAVHVETKETSDLTSFFDLYEGTLPASMWSSPSSYKLAFVPIEVNPDLYTATLVKSGNSIYISEIKTLNDQGNHYRWPDWSFARRIASIDNTGDYIQQEQTQTGNLIASGNYSSKYYVINSDTGEELFNVSPGVYGVNDVSLSKDHSRIYFGAKGTSDKFFELYGCDTLTGNNLLKISSFSRFGLKNIDANPINDSILVESVVGGIEQIFVFNDENSTPVQLTEDETLQVPGADDPTENWGSISPAWSPYGSKIAYVRYSKDTTGPSIKRLGAIITMNSDGSGKQAVYAEEGACFENLCWTCKGEFLLFTSGAANDSNKKVKAVHLQTSTVSDLTSGFSSHSAGVPCSLWSSPDRLAIVYAPIEVNPEFYNAELSQYGSSLSVTSIKKLTQEDKKHYRKPDWVNAVTAHSN